MLKSLVVAAAALSLAPLALAVDAAKPLAEVEIKLDDAKLVEKGANIRTLYITLYNAASPTPRPYGAAKIELKQDAKGSIYKGVLDANNIVIMGGTATPEKLRIKARLDKDGSAGPDAPGDLVGIADNVALGAKIVITIDKAL